MLFNFFFFSFLSYSNLGNMPRIFVYFQYIVKYLTRMCNREYKTRWICHTFRHDVTKVCTYWLLMEYIIINHQLSVERGLFMRIITLWKLLFGNFWRQYSMAKVSSIFFVKEKFSFDLVKLRVIIFNENSENVIRKFHLMQMIWCS